MARIAVVAGDGIGTEVTAQARKVIDAVLPGVEYSDYDLGARFYQRTGEVLPQSVEDELAGHDAILLGAVGDPSVPPGVLERGLLLKLRFDFDQYVNLRPSRLWPGTFSPLAGVKPGEIDIVVVREGTEGRHVNPARPVCTRTLALRISHFPKPQNRRYPRRHRRERAPSQDPCSPPLDVRGMPE